MVEFFFVQLGAKLLEIGGGNVEKYNIMGTQTDENQEYRKIFKMNTPLYVDFRYYFFRVTKVTQIMGKHTVSS